jgi:hypothetical protein
MAIDGRQFVKMMMEIRIAVNVEKQKEQKCQRRKGKKLFFDCLEK